MLVQAQIHVIKAVYLLLQLPQLIGLLIIFCLHGNFQNSRYSFHTKDGSSVLLCITGIRKFSVWPFGENFVDYYTKLRQLIKVRQET